MSIQLVKEAGGFAGAERKKNWGGIAKKLGLRSSTKLKEAYQDILLPFIPIIEVGASPFFLFLFSIPECGQN